MRRKYELGEYSRRLKADKKQTAGPQKLTPAKANNNWKNTGEWIGNYEGVAVLNTTKHLFNEMMTVP